MDALIKDIRYVADVEVPDATPLEVATRAIHVDSIVVTIDVGPVTDHQLFFAPEAIGNRMAGYGSATEKEAIETLVRELIFRWSPSLNAADPTNRVEINGGIDDRIDISWDKPADAAVAGVIAPNADRIAAARAFFNDQGTDQGSVAAQPDEPPPAPSSGSVVFDAAAPDKPAA